MDGIPEEKRFRQRLWRHLPGFLIGLGIFTPWPPPGKQLLLLLIPFGLLLGAIGASITSGKQRMKILCAMLLMVVFLKNENFLWEYTLRIGNLKKTT